MFPGWKLGDQEDSEALFAPMHLLCALMVLDLSFDGSLRNNILEFGLILKINLFCNSFSSTMKYHHIVR